MFELNEQVAIVTGAAGGLGKGICATLAKLGAKVVLIDVDAAALEARVAEFDRQDVRAALSLTCDVSKVDEIRSMVEKVGTELGRIDILVNNAGGSLHTPKELEQIKEADWDKVLNVNLKGTFLCCQAVVPWMRRGGGGSIVNMASIGGRTASTVTGVAYAAAKGGVIALTRRLALELGKYNIRVNAVAPGFVFSSPRLRELWDQQTEEEKRAVQQSIPLGRHGEVEEIASVVAFLAGRGASWITGAVMDVNGGRFMG